MNTLDGLNSILGPEKEGSMTLKTTRYTIWKIEKMFLKLRVAVNYKIIPTGSHMCS